MVRRAAARDSETEPVAGSSPRLYQRLFRILAGQIDHGTLPVGVPLTETSLAARFGISRAPVRRALTELVEAGLVEKATPRGYAVKSDRKATSTESWHDEKGETADRKLVSMPSWERIYGDVESEIIARISFASWRVNEAELARHYRVSRTVARDVIGRLQQRGVVQKDDRSRWFAPGLTPVHVGELYELRWLLEPVALIKAAPNIPKPVLEEVRDNLLEAIAHASNVTGTTLDHREHDLHVVLLGYCGNPTLMQAITLHQSLLIAHRFLYRWTSRLFETEPFLPEHLQVLDRLKAGHVKDAAKALESHLKDSRERAIARIEVIASGSQPDPLSYLERVSLSGTERAHNSQAVGWNGGRGLF
ncbi:GntR family transcriptional regulator [Mesorhizobium sp. WSM2239]|uniref:GntR family transcriptional regulator n=2 Tax=unclassified Mesorhizobium TaxID=325217 RepID=A0AAU8DHF6_9HYPH